MSTEYLTENLIAGPCNTQQVKFAADTYYRGMPLEYDADNDRYQYYGTSTSIIAGIFLEDESRAISANGYGSIIKGGEVYEGGIVDDSGDAYTITEDIIDAWAKLGIYIKRT
jgi:hypothetical protein